MSIAVVDTNYCYQAAAHLNNVGISLLLRDDFVNATLTLSDAIQVIKMTSSAKGEYLSSSAVQQKLKNASRRLLYPSSASTSNLPIFRIVSEDESPRALHAGTQTPCLIDMDSVQVEGIPSEQDLTILSSVIFYHHGVSYRYLASTRQDESTQNFERGALHMFKLSLRIAALHRGRIHTILALRNIVDLGKILGLQQKEQQEYESRLRYETYSAEAMERRTWAPKRMRPAPAA